MDKKEKKNDKPKVEPKSKERCYHCNKKLKMIHFTCRCNHKFCIMCISKWFLNKNTCPLCRRIFNLELLFNLPTFIIL